MIKYAPIKVVACGKYQHQPVGYNRVGQNYTFPDLNTAYQYFETTDAWSFPCGCMFEVKEIIVDGKV